MNRKIIIDYSNSRGQFVRVTEHAHDYTLVYDTTTEHGYDSSTSREAILAHANRRLAEIEANADR